MSKHIAMPPVTEVWGAVQEWLANEKRVVVIHRLHQILEPFMLRRQVQDVEGSLPEKVRLLCPHPPPPSAPPRPPRGTPDSGLLPPAVSATAMEQHGTCNIGKVWLVRTWRGLARGV